jgi:glycosyltransferase involved in cell wall biosynthesis
MNTSSFKGNVTIVKNISFFGEKAYWQTNVIKWLFKPYSHYIILGEERCLSTWLFLLLSLLFPKKKIYFWTHGQYGRENVIKKFISRLFYCFVDGAFLYGDYAKKVMISNGFDANKLFVIHNSLAYDRQLKLRNKNLVSDIYKCHFGNDYPVMIFIGRLTAIKKLDLVLDALSNLIDNDEKYNFVFVGDGSERNKLELLVKKRGLDSYVWFYGACYDDSTNAELIYNADLCVAPGNVGLTSIHTMMFGCPVITHNSFPWQMPEFEAIRPGVTGDFFERDNAKDLADTVSKWFTIHSDNRNEVRENCYREIDAFWNPHYQIEIFKQILCK